MNRTEQMYIERYWKFSRFWEEIEAHFVFFCKIMDWSVWPDMKINEEFKMDEMYAKEQWKRSIKFLRVIRVPFYVDHMALCRIPFWASYFEHIFRPHRPPTPRWPKDGVDCHLRVATDQPVAIIMSLSARATSLVHIPDLQAIFASVAGKIVARKTWNYYNRSQRSVHLKKYCVRGASVLWFG